MGKHYLAIQHESYDASTVYGVFDTFTAARDHVESLAEGARTVWADIEEWDAATHVATFEQGRPHEWRESRH